MGNGDHSGDDPKEKFGFTSGTIVDVDGESFDPLDDDEEATRSMEVPDDWDDDAEPTRTLDVLDMDDDASMATVALDAPDMELQRRPLGVLRVIDGPDLDREFDLSKDSNVVGRSFECDIVLRDPAVSRKHFRVDTRADGTFVVIDLGSGNGTLVDGVREPEHAVVDPVTIAAGKTTLQLVIDGVAPARVPPEAMASAGAPAPPAPSPAPPHAGNPRGAAPSAAYGGSAPDNAYGGQPPPPDFEDEFEADSAGGFRWGVLGVLLLLIGGGVWATGEFAMGWWNLLGTGTPQTEVASSSEGVSTSEANDGAAQRDEGGEDPSGSGGSAAVDPANAGGAAANSGVKPGGTEPAKVPADPCSQYKQIAIAKQPEKRALILEEAAKLSPAACSARLELIRNAPGTPGDPGNVQPTLDDKLAAQVRALYDEGMADYRNKAFRSACDKLERAKKANLGTTAETLDEGYKLAKRECDALDYIEQAKLKLQGAAYAEAKVLLMQVGPKLMNGNAAADLLGKVEDAHYESIKASATDSIKARDLAKATASVATGLGLFPNDERLKQLQKTMAAGLGPAYELLVGGPLPDEPVPSEPVPSKPDTGTAAVAPTNADPDVKPNTAAVAPPSTTKVKPPKTETKPLRFEAALAAYKSGNYNKARSELTKLKGQSASSSDKKKLSSMSKSLTKFVDNYQSGKSAAQSRSSSALSKLEKAYKADKIWGGQHKRELGALIADAYAVKAASEYDKKRYSDAASFASKALKYSKSHENATQVRKKCIAKADSLFEQAMRNKERNLKHLARSLFEQVIAILPKSSDKHKQAKKELKSL